MRFTNFMSCTKMFNEFFERCCLKPEKEELNNPLISLSIVESQPTIWNKYGKTKTENYPILTTLGINQERNNKVTEILGVKVINFTKNEQIYNLARSIHDEFSAIGHINLMARNYEYAGTFSNKRQPQPVFVYMGSFEDDSIFAVVLNEVGESRKTYVGKSINPDNVRKLWEGILNDFDFRSGIQSVVLFGKFYEKAIQHKCPVLENGGDLSTLWDNDLNNFYYSEIQYEELGFTNALKKCSEEATFSSTPSFCVVDRFNGEKRACPFSKIRNELVCHLQEKSLSLISPKNGMAVQKHNIIDVSPINIAEIIVNQV